MMKKLHDPSERYLQSSGFGLVEAIVSLSLLAGVISYGVYFATMRATIQHKSNLTKAINKEIQRDVERLKSDLWNRYFDKDLRTYWDRKESNRTYMSWGFCRDAYFTVINLPHWQIQSTRPSASSPAPPPRTLRTQYWWPDATKNRVFGGRSVLIARTVNTIKPRRMINCGMSCLNMDRSIASISYRVEYGDKNIRWLNIDLSPEAHSWCDQRAF